MIVEYKIKKRKIYYILAYLIYYSQSVSISIYRFIEIIIFLISFRNI
jgi:hypothetical protein